MLLLHAGTGGRPCLPAGTMHSMARCRRIEGSTITTATAAAPPALSPSPYCTPPPTSIHSSSFQQVIQRANKEASSFCPFWNVQCQKEGEMGEGGQGWDSNYAFNPLDKGEQPGFPYFGINTCADKLVRRIYSQSTTKPVIRSDAGRCFLLKTKVYKTFCYFTSIEADPI